MSNIGTNFAFWSIYLISKGAVQRCFAELATSKPFLTIKRYLASGNIEFINGIFKLFAQVFSTTNFAFDFLSNLSNSFFINCLTFGLASSEVNRSVVLVIFPCLHI